MSCQDWQTAFPENPFQILRLPFWWQSLFSISVF
jgi:hypothetical protein